MRSPPRFSGLVIAAACLSTVSSQNVAQLVHRPLIFCPAQRIGDMDADTLRDSGADGQAHYLTQNTGTWSHRRNSREIGTN